MAPEVGKLRTAAKREMGREGKGKERRGERGEGREKGVLQLSTMGGQRTGECEPVDCVLVLGGDLEETKNLEVLENDDHNLVMALNKHHAACLADRASRQAGPRLTTTTR